MKTIQELRDMIPVHTLDDCWNLAKAATETQTAVYGLTPKAGESREYLSSRLIEYGVSVLVGSEATETILSRLVTEMMVIASVAGIDLQELTVSRANTDFPRHLKEHLGPDMAAMKLIGTQEPDDEKPKDSSGGL